ncbi:high choriolytic enzyme 2 isoform X1 [Lepeophtheirus salmonis]|uniref:high choriolytic enzyme 2 isoform X1 n=1 Tax=Lepeophtheirus salmonis TaxID=72036 RepID=UPI001AE58E3A|nr:high choriolytic enzyme 2-like [Lepeophtheirus salmonis]
MKLLLSLTLLICVYTSQSKGIPKIENQTLSCSLVIDDRFNPEKINRNIVDSRWPRGKVPYKFTSSYSRKEINLIRSAMKDIQSRSCVKFVKARPKHKHYVDIGSDQKGCHASLGFNKDIGRHYVNLERPGCMFLSVIQHELLHHILGFDHEQNRPDRNSYVRINWQYLNQDSFRSFFRSVEKGTAPLPQKCDPSRGYTFDDCYSGYFTDTLGLPYDYMSIMHYAKDSFTKYPGYNVMDPLQQGGENMGKSRKMTDLDHDKLYKAYGCKESTTTTTSVAPCEDIYTNCNVLTQWCRDQDKRDNCRKTCRYCQ